MSNTNQNPGSIATNGKTSEGSMEDVETAQLISNSCMLPIRLNDYLLSQVSPTTLSSPIMPLEPFMLKVGSKEINMIELEFNDTGSIEILDSLWTIQSQDASSCTITNSTTKNDPIASVRLVSSNDTDSFEIILVGTVPIGDPEETE